MATKTEKISKKEAKSKEVKVLKSSETQKRREKEKYFEGIGRRKEAVARVRLYVLMSETEKEQSILVNEKLLKEYFPLAELQNAVEAPMNALGLEKKSRATVKVSGGGIRGQAEAVRLGIARALVRYNEENRKPLRDLGFLTRDDRVVERKKAGLKKARRAPQWQKR